MIDATKWSILRKVFPTSSLAIDRDRANRSVAAHCKKNSVQNFQIPEIEVVIRWPVWNLHKNFQSNWKYCTNRRFSTLGPFESVWKSLEKTDLPRNRRGTLKSRRWWRRHSQKDRSPKIFLSFLVSELWRVGPSQDCPRHLRCLIRYQPQHFHDRRACSNFNFRTGRPCEIHEREVHIRGNYNL